MPADFSFSGLSRVRVPLLAALVASGVFAVGCGDDTPASTPADASTSNDASTDASTNTDASTGSDASTGNDGSTGDGGAGTVSVRVAHLSPGAPAVDVCVRPASATSWTGIRPTLAGLGVSAGLAYSQVTAYLTLPADTYTVRIVAPGSANCDTALAMLPDVPLPALAAGTRATVGAVGIVGETGANAFRLQPYVEDALATAAQAKVRFVHASPGTPNVDVGIPGTGTAFTPLFSDIAFPNAGTALALPTAVENATVAARVAGMATAAGMYPLQLTGVNIPLGATVSVFAIGRLGNATTPLRALVCNDAMTTAGGALTACSVLPAETAPANVNVRVAHLSPGAPAVDVCVRPASATSWTGIRPTLAGLGVAAGLAYSQVTAYLTLPANTYTVRIVAPGSANCDTALAMLPDYPLPALAAGARATIGAVGIVGDSGATAFRLQPYVEDALATASEAKVRFVHASPGTPAVDVGIPGTGTAFTPLFSNIAFPNAATALALPTAVSNATVAARVAGMATAAGMYPLQVAGVNVPLGATASVFAIGRLGNATTPLRALICNDGMTSGSLTSCSVLP